MRLIVMRVNAPEPCYFCLCCNEASFVEGEERGYERHVARCSTVHDEKLRADSIRTRMPLIFDPHVSGDVELTRWIRRHRGMLLEGRMTL